MAPTERKKKLTNPPPQQPKAAYQAEASTGTPEQRTNIYGQVIANASASQPSTRSAQLPDGSEPAAFLRFARQRFNHIQAMNSASNLSEIARYLTPELYQAMREDILNNQDQDVAEFTDLQASLIDSAIEDDLMIASVRFNGMVSEDLHSQSQPFAEIWHFVKANNEQDWCVAGIEQTAQ